MVVVFLVVVGFSVGVLVFAWFGLVSLLSLCFFACLRSFTDWCIAHRQQSREQKKPKTCWLVDSGATCHIVSEKWVKHYTVSFEYQGPRPSLKGAGDNDLPAKGVVDLEFMVGKTKVTMKRVVVVGIPLNVISTYALLETGEDCRR